MSLKTRIWRILGKLDRRTTLIEDVVQQTSGAVVDVLEIATDLKATAANLNATAARLEAAVVEQGKTLDRAMVTVNDERHRRAGLGAEVLELRHRVGLLEEERRPNGAA